MPSLTEQSRMKVLTGVKRVKGRDIVRVEINGVIQPFYKSSGNNSQKPGEWLPFDGLYIMYGRVKWFDKKRFVCNAGGKYHNIDHACLHRYGTEELKKVSAVLGACPIKEAEETCPFEVNEWLGYVNPFKEVEKTDAKQLGLV